MSDLHTGGSIRRPVKFLAIAIGLAAIVFAASFASIFLKEFLEQSAASKKVTAPKLGSARPGMPAVQVVVPEPADTETGEKTKAESSGKNEP